MSQQDIAVAKELIQLDHFAERLYRGAELLGMLWHVQRRKEDGTIVKKPVVNVSSKSGFALISDQHDGVLIYGQHMLMQPGHTPWLIDESDPVFMEVNRILHVYNRDITAPLFKTMRDILPFSKLLIDRYPVYNTNPQFATYLAVNPINEIEGYRINKDGKFAWWTGKGKHHDYDVIELA